MTIAGRTGSTVTQTEDTYKYHDFADGVVARPSSLDKLRYR